MPPSVDIAPQSPDQAASWMCGMETSEVGVCDDCTAVSGWWNNTECGCERWSKRRKMGRCVDDKCEDGVSPHLGQISDPSRRSGTCLGYLAQVVVLARAWTVTTAQRYHVTRQIVAGFPCRYVFAAASHRPVHHSCSSSPSRLRIQIRYRGRLLLTVLHPRRQYASY